MAVGFGNAHVETGPVGCPFLQALLRQEATRRGGLRLRCRSVFGRPVQDESGARVMATENAFPRLRSSGWVGK